MTDWSAYAPADRLVTMPQGLPKLTLGYAAAAWAVDNLIQPNGPRQGQRWQPIPSQLHWLLWWYAVDDDGEWLFDHGARRLSKGSGKSPFAGVIGLTEFLGPVRLADFDPDVPGGCVGKTQAMPWVQIVAVSESQTANTMRAIRALAPKKSLLVREYDIDWGLTKYHIVPEGTLEAKTSSAESSDGAEASLVIADETEHWKPGNGGPTLHSTLLDNLAKSGSRMVETNNAWEPGIGAVAEETYLAWVGQEEGRSQAPQKILYDARLAPPDTDIMDDASLTKALEFVYDGCYWVKFAAIKSRIWKNNARLDDSKRKYLNWPTASDDAWLEDSMAWSRLADPTVVVPDGEEIALFFDGSKSRDATALMGCTLDTGHVFTLGVWEPDTKHTSESTVDVSDVDRTVRMAFERYQPLGFFGDVREFEGQVLTDWPRRYKDRLIVWALTAGKPPQPIAWDMRSRGDDFAKAAEACHEEIMSGAFTHDGDSRVQRHIGNCRRNPHKQWISVRKESKDSPRTIDAGVCVIGVRMVRRAVIGSKEYEKRKRKVTGRGRVVVHR